MQIIPLGNFKWTCESDIVVKPVVEDVPFFNAAIFLEDKNQIGKIDEIFGNIRDYYVTVKLTENVSAKSFEKNQQVIMFYLTMYF